MNLLATRIDAITLPGSCLGYYVDLNDCILSIWADGVNNFNPTKLYSTKRCGGRIWHQVPRSTCPYIKRAFVAAVKLLGVTNTLPV